jgi:NADPH:quinone reductase-like Zn-dependent oxidoreductase
MATKWTNRWVLTSQKGLNSLEFQKGAPVPELGQEDVLVELRAASLNYRELVITKVSLRAACSILYTWLTLS